MTDAEARSALEGKVRSDAAQLAFDGLHFTEADRHMLANSLWAFATCVLNEYLALRGDNFVETKGETQ